MYIICTSIQMCICLYISPSFCVRLFGCVVRRNLCCFQGRWGPAYCKSWYSCKHYDDKWRTLCDSLCILFQDCQMMRTQHDNSWTLSEKELAAFAMLHWWPCTCSCIDWNKQFVLERLIRWRECIALRCVPGHLWEGYRPTQHDNTPCS